MYDACSSKVNGCEEKNTGNYLADITAILKESNDRAEALAIKRAAEEAEANAEWSRKLRERDLPDHLLKIIDDANAEYEYNKANGYSNE